MAIAYVNGIANWHNTSSELLSISSDALSATAGNCIVVGTMFYGTTSPTNITDTAGNIYTKIGSSWVDNSYRLDIWVAKNIIGHANNVVTASNEETDTTALRIGVAQFSGVDKLDPVDPLFLPGGIQDTSSPWVSASGTTVSANEMLVGFFQDDGGGTTFDSSGSTVRSQPSGQPDFSVVTLPVASAGSGKSIEITGGTGFFEIVVVALIPERNVVTKVIDPDMGSGYDYDSLYDWEAAQQGDLTGARNEIAVAKCRCTGGTADTTAVAIDGWTTSATQFVKIWTDTTESYRHNGTWQTGNKYRIETTSTPISIEEENIRIYGIQIYLDYGGIGYNIRYNGTGNFHIGFSILKCNPGVASSNYRGIFSGSASGIILLYNNLFLDINDAYGDGICCRIAGGITTYVYNNTFVNCDGIGFYGSSNSYLKNNIFSACASATYNLTAGNCGYNSTNLSSLGYTAQTGDRVSQTFSFVGASDFHLQASDAGALGYGLNLYNDAAYPFQTDIDGEDRGGAGHFWSIGADGGYEERTFVVDPDMGSGYHYDSLYDWEAAQQKVAVCPEVAKCRCTGGTADTTGPVDVTGWTVSATQYIKIWTDPSESYRHNGTWQTGNKYRLEVANVAASWAALITRQNYIKIIGLQVSVDIAVNNTTSAFCITNAAAEAAIEGLVDSCIVKPLSSTYGVGINNYKWIINCLSIGGAVSFLCGSNTAFIHYHYNCTAINASVAGFVNSSAAVEMACVNCLAYNSTAWSTDAFYQPAGTITTAYCASNDGSADDYSVGGFNRTDQIFTFVNAGAGDYHLTSNDTGALGYGLNLYNDSNYAFQTDIDGNDRGGSGHFWSIGADGGYEERTFVIDPDTGTGYDYDSLYDWEAARQSVLVIPEVAKCRCTGGTADTTAVTIDGWTTSATQYIKIWTDPSESYRHNGAWQTGNKYRIVTTITSNGQLILVEDNNARIIGLQFEVSSTGTFAYAHEVIFGASSQITGGLISECIFKCGTHAGTINYIHGVWVGSVGSTVNFINSIFYDFGDANIYSCGIYQDANGTIRVYNCTFSDCYRSIYTASTNIYAINCIFNNSTNSDANGVTSVTYSSTTLGTLSGTGNRVSQIFSFVNESAADFHLQSNDTGALGYGLNLYNDANYPFQTDIDGQDRGGAGHFWSIGADGGYEERTFVIDPDMGTGYHYDSLYDWEAAQQKTCVCPEVAKCRCTGGTADTTAVTVSGWTTSATQYVKIWTDTAESYRHNGTYQAGNKSRLIVNGGTICLDIDSGCKHIVIDGLMIGYTSPSDEASCIQVVHGSSAWAKISNCIFKASGGTDQREHYIRASGSIVHVYNCIGFNGGALESSANSGVYQWDGTTTLYNCTFKHSRYGIQAASGTIIAKNCYSGGGSVADYTGTITMTTCASSDATGTTGLQNIAFNTINFTNVTADSEDFHLPQSSALIGQGTNLYNDATYPFQTDIDGQDRGGNGHFWSIGADGGYEERTFVIDPDMGTGYHYDSLYDWEAAQQKVCVCPEVAKCRCTGGTADTTAVEIDGWTTSATQYIKVWTDPSESYRHNGTWQTGNKYRHSTAQEGIVVSDPYIRIQGIQIEATSISEMQSCTVYLNANYVLFSEGIVKVAANNYAFAGILCYGNPIYIINSIVIGSGNYNWSNSNACISNIETLYIFNCTLVTSAAYASGITNMDGDGIIYAKNLYISAPNCFFAEGTVNKTTCATSDTTGSIGLQNIALNTTNFTNVTAGSENFHLPATSALIGQGTNLYNDADYPFQTDIDGQDRSGAAAAWDIGADEYVSSVIAGSTCWGHVTGVTQDNVRTFTGHGSGTATIENSGDTERLKFAAGQYWEFETVNTGARDITISLNSYAAGAAVTVKYRTGTTQVLCEAESWTTGASFTSTGFAQIRLEA